MIPAALLMGAFLLTGTPPRAPVAVRSPEHFRIVPLGQGVYAAIARPGDPEAAGNAGFVVGGEAVLVIDAFATPAAARELLAQIRATTKLPVRWLITSHDRPDSIGGNTVFAREGAVVIAHENAWSRASSKPVGESLEPEKKKPPPSALPELTHRQGLTVWPGSRRVDVLSRPGHTDGDSVVHVPGADVVFAGDLFWNATVPSLADADTAAWLITLDGFLNDFPRAVFVPGHGQPGHALEVRFFRDYLFGLRQTVARAIEEGLVGTALVDSVLPLHRARFGAWTGFDRFAAKNIEATERELRGKK